MLTALRDYRNSREASKDGNRAQSIQNRTEREMLVMLGKETGEPFVLALDKVHIKGVISLSPDSFIFSYIEKC